MVVQGPPEMPTLARVGLCAALTGLAVSAAPRALGAPVRAVPGTPYYLRTQPAPYAPCPSPIVLTRSALGVTFDLALPFPFRFYDAERRSLTVSSDGALALPENDVSAATWALNQGLGVDAAPNGLIAPWWDDLALFAGNQGYIAYSVLGAAPRRTLCVEWRRMSTDAGGASSPHRISMQVRLHEGRYGRIDVAYAMPLGSSGLPSSATVGMEDPAGRRPLSWAPVDRCGPFGARCSDDVLTDFTDTQVTLLQDAGSELVALEVEGPVVAAIGQAMTVDATVESQHHRDLGPFAVEVWASHTPNLTNPVRVGRTQVSLHAFEARALQIPATIPSEIGPGPVWLELVVDAQAAIVEPDEQNNRVTSASPTRVLTPGPDLAVGRVSTSRDRVRPGDTLEITARVENLGSANVTAAPVAVQLSTNPVITPQDLELGRGRVTIGAGESSTLRLTVTLPRDIAAGSYHVGALADPDGGLPELDEGNNGLAAPEPLVVAGGPLRITRAELPRAALEQPYQVRLTARGGEPPYTWNLEAGALPAGLRLDEPTGRLSGQPAALGTYPFSVKLGAADGQRAHADYVLEVRDVDAPLTVVTRQLPDAEVGVPYLFAALAAGGPGDAVPAWSATGLPPGLSLSSAGALVGTPLEAGGYEVTLDVTVGAARARRVVPLEVFVARQLSIIVEPLPPADLGSPYEARLRSNGGLAPITWRIAEGRRPPGLVLTPDGRITGTPAAAGRWRFVVEAIDAGRGRPAQRTRETLELAVLGGPGLELVTRSLPEATAGQGFVGLVRATGGQGPYTWTVEPDLPPGLFADADGTDLRIFGTPARPVQLGLLVEIRDVEGRTAARAYSLIVSNPLDAPPPEDGGCRSVGGEGALTALALLSALLGIRRRSRSR